MATATRGKTPDGVQIRVLPMHLKIGDRITDKTGGWEVVERPYTIGGGKECPCPAFRKLATFGYPKRLIVRLTRWTGFDRRAWPRFVARGIHRLKAMIRHGQAWRCPPRWATSTRTRSRYHRDGRGCEPCGDAAWTVLDQGPGCPGRLVKTRAPAGTDRRGSARRS
jgi:hypothetical protein